MAAQVDPQFLATLIDAEALYQDAPCGYLSFLPDGTIIKINRTLLKWLEYTDEQVITKMKFSELLSTGGRLYYQMFYYPLILFKGTVNEISFDICRKNGSRFPALLNSVSLKDDEGQILAVNVVITDITDRKKYETELLRAKQLAEAEKFKFEFVSDFIPEMIWGATADGHINYFNKRFLDNFEVTATASLRKNLIQHIHPDDRTASLRIWAEAIRNGEDFDIQLRLQNKLGLFSWYLLKGLPYREADGRISRWLGSCLNINSHVLELGQKDEFISIASHELKTPITSLKLTLQLLERMSLDGLPDKYSKLIEQSGRSIAKIVTLVDELLNVNRVNAGQMVLNKTEINIMDMLDGCCHHVRAEGSYNLLVTGDRSIVIVGDEHRIDQVVVNFVNNAIKYAPESTTIYISVSVQNETARIEVTDTGPGISAEKLPHLFERYYRADHAGVQYSGLGLGLYICAEIIKRHGGKIGVDSEFGKGSTFWFTLPVPIDKDPESVG
jgi:PAS domain S-box-containing protein